MLLKRINALWHPECYHGWGKSKRFFEGWYYKIISADQKAAFAIIPGIAMDEQGQKQVFIQVLDGKKCSAVYYRFDESTFDPHPKIHHLKIRDNTFSLQKMTLHLPGLQGEVTFDGLNPWSNSLFSPGIMGPFSFVPLMECYHGILSMDHRLTGQLIVDGKTVQSSNVVDLLSDLARKKKTTKPPKGMDTLLDVLKARNIAKSLIINETRRSALDSTRPVRSVPSRKIKPKLPFTWTEKKYKNGI